MAKHQHFRGLMNLSLSLNHMTMFGEAINDSFWKLFEWVQCIRPTIINESELKFKESKL